MAIGRNALSIWIFASGIGMCVAAEPASGSSPAAARIGTRAPDEPGLELLEPDEPGAEIPDELALTQRYAEAVAALIVELKELADWCASSQLFIERNVTYELVLHFDPDDGDAHRGLKHEFRDGVWVVPDDLAEPRNYQPARLRTSEKRRAKLVEAFRGPALVLADAARAGELDELAGRIEKDLLHLDPDDAEVRARRGEVRDEPAGAGAGADGDQAGAAASPWVLSETVGARAQRSVLRDRLRSALAEVERPAEAQPTASEAEWGVPWKACRANGSVRVLSTNGAGEAEMVAQRCEVARLYCTALLGKELEFRAGNTLYLMSGSEERDRFLDGYRGFTPREREERRRFSGTGLLDYGGYADWSEEDARRLDGAVRHSIAALLADHYRLSIECGWAWEGLGLFLTRQLTGTRLTWYATTGFDDPELFELRGKLAGAEVNWINEAWKLLSEGRATPFEEFLGRSIDRMNAADTLIAYAFAAYLLEGFPEELPRVLERLGEGVASTEAISEVLGRPLSEIRSRFERWLTERR